jgi:hypothetical protein
MKAMEKRKAYEQKLAAQWEEWHALAALAEARAEKSTVGARMEYYELAELLQRKQQVARVRLTELQEAGNETWLELISGAEKAWSEIGAVFQSAACRLK